MDRAVADLRQVYASQLPPQRKFVAYHKALDAIVRVGSDIAHEFHILRIFAGEREPIGEELNASSGLAAGIVKVINRAAREHVQSAYSLNYHF